MKQKNNKFQKKSKNTTAILEHNIIFLIFFVQKTSG